MRVAALSLLVLSTILPVPTTMAQPELVLKAACIGGYANTVTEVAVTADGTISRQRYFNSGGKGKGWRVLGRDTDRVERWLKSVDATEMSPVRAPTTVGRDPCNIGGSPACHILRRKDNVDYFVCRSRDVLKEMMDFNEWTARPRADEAFQVMEAWTRASKASDIDAIIKLFAPDALLMGADSKTVITGQAHIRKYFEDSFLTRRTRVLGITQQNAVLSDDVVLVTQYSVWTNAPEGYSFPERITFVLARRGVGWLIVHFHSSATPN
jgi:uncharacterized protein (TIGR02246 family)